MVNKVNPQGDPLAGADFALYKFIGEFTALPDEMTEEEAAEAGYIYHPGANCWGKFVEVDRKTTTAGTTFTFKGIDDGYYKLEEVVVPEGYKKMEDVEFHVTAKHAITGITELKATVKGGSSQTISGDAATGTLTAVVENHTGIELPSTGGMGTTLFYVLGSIMVMGAVVLLITKKRMAV